MRPTLRFTLAALACLLTSVESASARAQDALGLACNSRVVDRRDLRAALEHELKVPVRLLEQPADASLLVEADDLSAVRVRFMRLEQPSVERTVDVSSQAAHSTTFIALLAANLVRDEAAELLTQLGPAAPPPAPTLEPEPLPAPAPEPTPAQAAPPSAAAPTPPPTAAQRPLSLACATNTLRKVKVGVDFVPYVGMSMRDSVNVERRFSFNILGGITGAVRGVEVAGLFNIERHTLCGTQLAGVFNYVGEDVSGVQLSGVFNYAGGNFKGVQLSTLNFARGGMLGAQLGQLNIAGSDVYGVQIGEVNVAGGYVRGVQLGLANVSAQDHEGAQLGLVNVSAQSLTGYQLGLANVVAGPARAAQIGLVNVIAGEARGAQLGLVNVSAQREHGTLIGLVNAARNADAALGLVNVIWRGRTHLDAWATDAGLLMLGLEHGARLTHNIWGVGFKPMAGGPAFTAAYGFGFRVVGTQPVQVDVDAVSFGLMRKDTDSSRIDFASIHQLRIPVTFRFVRGFGAFIAPSVSVSLINTESSLGGELALYKTTRLTQPANTDWHVRIWPGLSLGLRFF